MITTVPVATSLITVRVEWFTLMLMSHNTDQIFTNDYFFTTKYSVTVAENVSFIRVELNTRFIMTRRVEK